MDIGLLKSMFSGNVGTKPTSLKPVASPHTRQPATIPAGNASKVNMEKAATADNIQLAAQNGIAAKPSENFRHTLGKKILDKTSLDAQADKKTKKQDHSSVTLSEMVHPAKSLAVQGTQTQPAVLDNAIGAKVDNQLQQQIKSQATNKSVWLLSDSKTSQASSLIVQAAKPATNEPDQIVSTTTKPANKPIQPTIDQGQIKSEIILPGISNKLPISNTQFEKDKDIGKMQVSDEAFVAKEKLVNPENGKELLQEVLFSDSKTSTAGKKLIVTDKTSVSESPKTLETNKTAITSKAITDQKSGQEPASQMHGGDSKITITGEKSAMTDEPALSLLDTETTVSTKPVITSTFPSNQQSGKESAPKTPIGNNKITALGDQSSHSQQKVLAGQGNPAPAAEQTTPNKADTDQKDHRGKMGLFELPEKNRIQVENSSAKPIAQKMNPQQTQLSNTQAEIRNNLVSNQASSPDKNPGEQLLANNIQPAVTEQSPASATFTKIASNADSGASVGSQIQESIHSSLRSGGQQIIIRLNPPELGKVTIKFAEQGNDITGLLQVDKLQTRDQIQQMLPEMIQNLQNSGIGIKRLEVVLTNQQDQYASKDQSSTAGQDGWSGHQSSPNPESQRNNTTYNEWLTNVDNVIEFTEPQMHFANNSINMLV